MSTDSLYVAVTKQQQRWENAAAVKKLRRVNLPKMDAWNYGPCKYHKEPTAQCEYRLCGGDFFDHQTLSVAWAYIACNGHESSVPGAGKTNICLGLLCLCKHYGERIKTIIVCQTSAVSQWAAEAQRFAPGLNVVHLPSKTPKPARLSLYASDWEVLVIGHHMATRDIAHLEALDPLQVISDDVDPILNITNATAKAINRLTASTERVLTTNATSLQTRIEQVYAATMPIGGREIWGTLPSFQTRYVRKEPVWIRINGKLSKQMAVKGYKNLNDLRSKYEPMSIRHNYEDLNDVKMPEIMPPNHIWLDMYPAQRARYTELQEGVLTLLKKDEPPQQKAISALAAYTYGTQICAGLPALGEEDGPGKSVKLDWLENRIMTVWEDTKIVVFAKNIGTVQALQERLTKQGVGFATIWGRDSSSEGRAAEIKRFWEDPACRVMIGTSAIERSLNLQISNVLVYLDSIPNPARMTQLLGRVRRAGSKHSHVHLFYLMITDSQEERFMTSLGARQALIDAVNDEDESDLFGKLSPEELLKLISP